MPVGPPGAAFEIGFDRRQSAEHQQRQRGSDGGEHEMSCARGHADRRVHPDRGGGRHAVNRGAAAENGAAANVSMEVRR